MAFTLLSLGSAHAGFDINMTVDGGSVVDVGQFRGITVSYSWSSLPDGLSNGKIVIDLPAELDADNVVDVLVNGSPDVTSSVYDPATRKITYTFVDPLLSGSSGSVQFFVLFPDNAADGTLAAINATSSGTGQPDGTGSVILEANSPAATTITLAAIAGNTVGTAYNSSTAASGGVAPYTYAVIAGALPAWATLDANTGTITGTSNSTTAASFTIRATDANGYTGTRSYTVTPTCPTITVNPATLPNGVIGSAYSETLSATGGSAPYAFVVTSGSLPAGLTLSGSTITGTPTSTAGATFTIEATDIYDCTATVAFTITPACPTVTVNPATLPGGVVGSAYSEVLSAMGGTAPYTFAVTSGSLPAGLTLSGSTISGTPTSTASATFTITATDANGCTGTRAFTLTPACPAITVNPATLPSSTVGTPYSQSLSVSGGTAPYTFAVTSGALPVGLTLTGSAISGTPTSTASATFTITATDTIGCTGARTYVFTPACPVITMTPAPGALAQGTVGSAYSQTFSSTGSTGTLGWSVTSGTLPAGLAMSSTTGAITGTPTTATTGVNGTSISARTQDQYGCSITQAYTLKVCPTLIFPASMPAPVLLVPYSASAAASGGAAPYTYSLSGAPGWMSINSSTGEITGTPLTIGIVSFTVNAIDAYGCTGSKSYTTSTASLSLGNIVWNDPNNNGTKDAGELGLSGATVQLFSPGSDNAIGGSGGAADTQVGSSITTAATGSYVFSGLAPGKYFVKVTPPAGYNTSGTPDTADNADDNDNNGAQPGGLGTPVYSPIIDLAIGAESILDGDLDANTNYTVDFGLWSGIQVGNLVWLDANDNALKDGAETGISGLTVELLNSSGNTVLATTTTNGSGQYGFTVYSPGNYKVRVTPNATYPLASTSSASTDNGVDNNNDGDQTGQKNTPSVSPTITLTAGGEPGSSGSTNNENTIDFGFRGCPTISSTPTTLVSGNVGAPYSATVTANGGVGPYTYAVTSGSLPAGLSLASATGVISGTTSVSGNHVVTITATDSALCTGATAITLPISATPTYDYGDYSPFPLASSFVSTSLRFGALVVADAASPANGSASGDDTSNTDDEDGIVEPINLVPSVAGSTVVKVTNTTGATAYLNAWIDFNRNGSPNDAGEQVSVNVPIANGRTNSNETISFTTPAGAFIGFTAIRLRLTSTPSPSASGAVGMGEVEDYPVNICPTLGFAYGTQSADLYQIDVATGTVSKAADLPAGFDRSNGAAFAQSLGTDGVVLFTTGTTTLWLGAWDRFTGVTNVVGNLGSFGVPAGKVIYSGDFFNGWYYFVVNNTDDLWKAQVTGTSGAYTLVSATKISDMWSNSRSHGYGDIVITPGGIMYAHANRDGGGAEFFTADLNQATPTATQLGSPPYMHNGITFGLDGKLYGGLGVNSSNKDWFEVSLANGSSTYLRTGAVSGMSDMTMGACTPSQYLVDNDPFANNDFGDYSFVSGASSIVNTNIRLGSLVDAESTISNDATATADDVKGMDDEDGVTFGPFVQGQTATVTIARTNTSGSNAYLNAWIDFDNDGLLTGAGEKIINNVLISSGTNGSQNYTITVPAAAAVGDLGARFRITSTSNPAATGASGNGEVEDHLVTVQPALSIGNLVWNDLNNNGAKDATESGLAGATVQLFRAGADNLANTGDDVQVGAALTTNATGAYSFSILAPAKYFVKVTPPAGGFIASGTPATTDNNVDNNNDGTQPGAIGTALFSPVIDLTVNAESITDGDTDPNSNFTVDFGLFSGIQLGNQVWYDANDNGVKDGAENGINGLLVELLNAATNAVITSTTSNASGQYGFTVYSAGNYKVRVTPDPAYPLASSTFVTTDNGVDNDNNGQQPGLKNTPSTSGAFTLTPMAEPGPAGSSNIENTIDIGFRTCPTITVITTPSPLDIAVMKRPYSQVANSTGGLAPYAFSISAGALPSGITLSAGGVISGTPTADGIFNATILATDAKGCTGQTSVVIEVLPPLSVGNMVYLDSNGNGRADSGEGINGVTMQLYTSAQTPGVSTPVATTVTAGGGLYIFEGLLPGIYRVHVPASMFASGAPLYSTISVAEGLSGDDDVGENGLNSLTPETTGISSGLVTVAVGQAPTDLNGETGLDHASDNTYDAAIDLTVDFGFANPMGVGNLVFIDANTNGHYDAGEGVEGVTVDLYRSADTPGAAPPVSSQVTDADGHYLFDYLLAGSYFVHIAATEFNTGGPLEGKISAAGAGGAGVDDSADENGMDDGAPIINGIRSTTFTLANNTSPTNATGETGYLASEDSRDDNNYDLTIDLGFRLPDPNAVGVGNAVFLDANGNHFFDTGEGVDGVVVRLYEASADPGTTAPFATTVTANGGTYLFSGIPAGSYFIQIPGSMFVSGAPMYRMLSLPDQGGDNGIDDDQDENGDDPVTPSASGVRSTDFELTANQEPVNTGGEFGSNAFVDDTDDNNTDLTIDFGFYRPVGVGNLVFIDANRNGRFNAGEGLDGVTVELYQDTQSPGFEPALASTVTSGGGIYQFSDLVPGYYIVHIPTADFGPGGVLAAFTPLSGQGPDDGSDDDVDENGSDPALAFAEGVSSLTINLTSGTEPTDQTTEKGQGASADNANDSDTDLTVDFGFQANPPGTFTQWQAQNPLGGQNGPTLDPDGDGLSNTAEYVFGLSPSAGVLPWSPFEIKLNTVTNQIDAYVRKLPAINDVTVTIQGLLDLPLSPQGWFDITAVSPEYVSNTNGVDTYVWRNIDAHVSFAGGPGFARLHLVLDADHDGTPEATYNSDVWRWSRHNLQPQIISFSNPLSKAAVFTGPVTSVTGASLAVAAAVGSDAIAAAMSGTIPWYVEVVSGDNEGHRFEVDEASSTATTIVLETSNTLNTLTAIPASLAGDRIALRQHWTLAEWLPPSKFRATNNSSTADRLMFYTGTTFATTWLYSNAGNPKWVSDATLADRGTRVMDPCEALIIQPRSTSAPAFVNLGVVRAHKFASPLKQGTHLLAGGWPMDQSATSRGMLYSNGFTGATSATRADRVQIWAGDATSGANSYESHYLLKTATLQKWVKSGDASLLDENNLPLFRSMRGVYFSSYLGKPDYVAPLPWTP